MKYFVSPYRESQSKDLMIIRYTDFIRNLAASNNCPTLKKLTGVLHLWHIFSATLKYACLVEKNLSEF